MSRKTVMFRSKERRNLEELADFFHKFAEKLKQGEFTLHQGEEAVTVSVPHDVMLKLKMKEKAKKRKTKRTFKVTLQWYEGDEAPSKVTLE